MTTSHVIHRAAAPVAARSSLRGEPAGRLLGRFVRMMYHGGDLARPNCFEHYNPYTGHASVYRGIDDYQHSGVLDLLIRGVLASIPLPTASWLIRCPCTWTRPTSTDWSCGTTRLRLTER